MEASFTVVAVSPPFDIVVLVSPPAIILLGSVGSNYSILASAGAFFSSIFSSFFSSLAPSFFSSLISALAPLLAADEFLGTVILNGTFSV